MGAVSGLSRLCRCQGIPHRTLWQRHAAAGCGSLQQHGQLLLRCRQLVDAEGAAAAMSEGAALPSPSDLNHQK